VTQLGRSALLAIFFLSFLKCRPYQSTTGSSWSQRGLLRNTVDEKITTVTNLLNVGQVTPETW